MNLPRYYEPIQNSNVTPTENTVPATIPATERTSLNSNNMSVPISETCCERWSCKTLQICNILIPVVLLCIVSILAY